MLAELYAILTGVPHKPVIRPDEARASTDYVREHFTIIALGESDYGEAIDRMVSLNLPGGGSYDALHAHAALKAEADILLTLNDKHFTRLGDDVANLVPKP